MDKGVIEKLDAWKFALTVARYIPLETLLEAVEKATAVYKSNPTNKKAEDEYVSTSMVVIMKIAIQKEGFDAVMENIKKGELGKSFLDFKLN